MSPSITIAELDSNGITSFSYLGIKFTLEAPSDRINNNTFTVQTMFEHSRRAASINARIVEWNKALQEMGIGGKLTFRNIKGSFTFTYVKEMDTEKFRTRDFRHSLEYFLEMAIKLHNVINVNDIKKVDKIRLTL